MGRLGLGPPSWIGQGQECRLVPVFSADVLYMLYLFTPCLLAAVGCLHMNTAFLITEPVKSISINDIKNIDQQGHTKKCLMLQYAYNYGYNQYIHKLIFYSPGGGRDCDNCDQLPMM